MNKRILFVDDDPKILSGIERQLNDKFDIEAAGGPHAALELIEGCPPFAVVVSDMRMPQMNGVQLLSRIREIHPDTVRMMLTGYSDLKTTIDAVNEGNIFRFLAKPCAAEVLAKAISDGIQQYRLVMAERELVDGTLKGSVKVLTEVLALTSPLAFGRASRLQRIVLELGAVLGEENLWQLEIAALLSQLGCVTVPESTLRKVFDGQVLSPEEKNIFQEHPQVARTLLQNIPRLDYIAESIAYQAKCFDGTGFPADDYVSGEQIPRGARLLKIALDFDSNEQTTNDHIQAFTEMKAHAGRYDPEFLSALEILVANNSGFECYEVSIAELKDGMIFAENVMASHGQVMVAKGNEVTDSLRKRLLNLREIIQEPILVTESRTSLPATLTERIEA